MALALPDLDPVRGCFTRGKLKNCGELAPEVFKPGKVTLKVADAVSEQVLNVVKRLRRAEKPDCHSFVPSTAVLLADGSSRPIKDVKTGDEVLVTDPETGETAPREVVGTIVTEDDKEFVDLKVAGLEGEKGPLIATATHPFWAEETDSWVDAGDLKAGMGLRTPDGATVKVPSTRHFSELQRTHDLTVSGVHTYYVVAGGAPVLDSDQGPAVSQIRCRFFASRTLWQ